MIAPQADARRVEAGDWLRACYQRLAWPVVAFLFVGLTLHNLFVLGLIDLGIGIRAVKTLSAWKEVTIAVLLVGGLLVYRARLRTLNLVDLLVIAYLLLNVLYLLISPGSLIQRLYGLRLNSMFGVAYGLGRLLPVDRLGAGRTILTLLLAVAGAALLGVLEVFMIPTRAWVDWGLPAYTNSLGFHYSAPYGLPENLFVNLGVLVRRAISVYLSPLALAYSIVLVLPAAMWFLDRRRAPRAFGWALVVAILISGLAVTLTRAAILVAVAALMATVVVAIRRRAVALFGSALAVGLLIFIFMPSSATLTPAVDSNLNPVPNTGLQGAATHLIEGKDDSLNEHIRAQLLGLRVLRSHPLGLGIGQAGSIAVRFGSEGRPGENAYLQLGSELGWIGFALAVAIHLVVIVTLVRRQFLAFEDPIPAFGLLALIGGSAIFLLQGQSDILGDFPVVVPLWIAIGWLLTATRARTVTPTQ